MTTVEAPPQGSSSGCADEDHPLRAGVDRFGLLVAVTVAVALTVVSTMRHQNYWSGGLDLGVFDQGVWLLSRGLSPEVTVNGRNLFADHLSPVLFLFVPLYRLGATPVWLFAAQGLALGGTVLPMRALARHEGSPDWVATLLVALGAPLMAAAVFDFHPSTLAVPFVAWTLLESRRGNVGRATIAASLVLVCRAELGWLLIGIAIVAAPNVRRRLLALAPLGVVAGFAVPALLGARGTFTVHYGHLGSTASDAALHPWRLVIALLRVETLQKALLWLLPVAFLPLRRPRWLAALAVASAPILFSRWPGTSLPWFHYGAPLFPIAAGGALVALGERQRPPWLDGRLLVAATAISLAVMSPLSPKAPESVRASAVVRPQHGQAIRTAVSRVRSGEPVAAANRALAHLTHRRQAWLLPAPFAAGDVPGLSVRPSRRAGRGVRTIIAVSTQDRRRARFLGFRGQVTGGVFFGRR